MVCKVSAIVSRTQYVKIILLIIEYAVIILWMRTTNERRRYYVTSPLVGWEHSQNDPCINIWHKAWQHKTITWCNVDCFLRHSYINYARIWSQIWSVLYVSMLVLSLLLLVLGTEKACRVTIIRDRPIPESFVNVTNPKVLMYWHTVGHPFIEVGTLWRHDMGQVMELRLSCNLVLLSIDSKTR